MRPTVGKIVASRDDKGFTLVELLIAFMVMAVVMAALAPAFYGELKATAATNYRSTANGLAVAAIEDMRAFPYYEMGYNQTDYSTAGSTALTCVSPSNTFQAGGTAPSWNSSAGLNPVELTSGSALDNPINNLPSTQTISHVTFTITRCVYWVTSSTAKTAAYKLTWVGISWTAANIPWHVAQTSAIYPGGVGKYQSPGQNNDTPATPACGNSGTVPNPPLSLTATQDPSYPTTTVDLSWSANTQPSSVLPVMYEVEYSSIGSSGPFTPFGETGLLAVNVDGLAASTPYWFEVYSVACDGTPSTPLVTAQTTASAAQSCTATNFSVSPTSASINGNDKLIGGVSFQFSVNVSSGCNNAAAVYSPQGNGTNVTDYAPAGSGTLTWTASATTWKAGTVTFYLYIAGTSTGNSQSVKITCNSQSC